MIQARILVVGYGYIGRPLAQRLYREGDSVTAVNRSSEADLAPYPVLTADLGDAATVAALADELGEQPPNAIVHCASSGRGGADAYRSVFVDGVKNLREAFPDAPIVLTSSTSVYGQTDGSVVDESSPTEPARETGRLLLEAESLVREGNGVVLRLAGIYGPERSVHLKRLLGGDATIESGEVSRFLNQVHRDDAVGAIVHVLREILPAPGGRTYNVTDDTPVTQRQCYERLATMLGRPVPPEAPPNLGRKRAWTHKRVSNEALRETGWRPHYPSFFEAVFTDEHLVPSIREQLMRAEA